MSAETPSIHGSNDDLSKRPFWAIKDNTTHLACEKCVKAKRPEALKPEGDDEVVVFVGIVHDIVVPRACCYCGEATANAAWVTATAVPKMDCVRRVAPWLEPFS